MSLHSDGRASQSGSGRSRRLPVIWRASRTVSESDGKIDGAAPAAAGVASSRSAATTAIDVLLTPATYPGGRTLSAGSTGNACMRTP